MTTIEARIAFVVPQLICTLVGHPWSEAVIHELQKGQPEMCRVFESQDALEQHLASAGIPPHAVVALFDDKGGARGLTMFTGLRPRERRKFPQWAQFVSWAVSINRQPNVAHAAGQISNDFFVHFSPHLLKGRFPWGNPGRKERIHVDGSEIVYEAPAPTSHRRPVRRASGFSSFVRSCG